MNNIKTIIKNIEVKDWYDLLLRKEKYSHYIDQPLEYQVKYIQSELNELLAWIENNDKNNIKEEVTDVIYNTMQLLQSLLKKGLIDEETIKNSGKNQYMKIVKRQPQIKHQYKTKTYKEECDLFFKNK